MNTKVMIAFSNMIYSAGVKKLLEGTDFEVADVFKTSELKTGTNPYSMIKFFEPDVILVDFSTLYNEFGDVGQAHGMRLILLDTGCREDNITSAVTDKYRRGPIGLLRSEGSKANSDKKKGAFWPPFFYTKPARSLFRSIAAQLNNST